MFLSSRKELYVFLAGGAAFHALSHILLNFSDALPLVVWGITFTGQLNWLAVIVSLVLTAGFLYLARKEKR